MRAKGAIVPARAEHIPQIAPFVRLADREELWSMGRVHPLEALTLSLRYSTSAWTGLIDSVPAAMFGVSPGSAVTGTGVPWLIGTTLMEKHARLLLTLCRPHLAVMFTGYERLVNYVDARNVAAVRWLAWLGFAIEDPVPGGPDGALFHRFAMNDPGRR